MLNEGIEGTIHRAQFGQSLTISHPMGKRFALSGEIWHFTQPFLRSNAVGNLWAVSYRARRNLVFDKLVDKLQQHYGPKMLQMPEKEKPKTKPANGK
jgi:hypothetical protein